MGKLAPTILIAITLFVLDAFVLNQGVIALVVAVLILVWFFPRTLLLHYRKEKEAAKTLVWKIGIYATMVMAVLGTNYLNNQLARHRADLLIRACREFEIQHHRLPDKLESLVPDFIPKVPLAKYTLLSMSNRFWYLSRPDSHQLFYVELPPFDRPTYYFETDRWELVD